MVTRERIEEIVNEWIKSTDCFLVEVKTSPGKIAVCIDKPAGVTIMECSALNRHITEVLEPELVWETNELEVGSPGMSQPLRVPQQYLRRIGMEIRVITTDGRDLKGKLQAADENGIDLLETVLKKVDKKKVISETKYHLEYSKIKETKLILSFKN